MSTIDTTNRESISIYPENQPFEVISSPMALDGEANLRPGASIPITHLSEQHTLLYYRGQVEKYHSLTEFFNDHAYDNGEEALSISLISSDRYKSLYEADVKKLSAFSLFELDQKVRVLSKSFPTYDPKKITDIVSTEDLRSRDLVEQIKWSALRGGLSEFTEWAKDLNALSLSKETMMKSIDSDYDTAILQTGAQYRATNHWFNLRIFKWNAIQYIQNIWERVLGLFTTSSKELQPPILKGLRDNIEIEEGLNLKRASDATKDFRKRASEIRKRFSTEVRDEVFIESISKAWSGQESTHMQFLDSHKKAVSTLEVMADHVDTRISSLENHYGVSSIERWSQELYHFGNSIVSEHGSLTRNSKHILEYLSQPGYSDEIPNIYRLLNISSSTNDETCIAILDKLEDQLVGILGSSSLLSEYVRNAKKVFTDDALRFASKLNNYHPISKRANPALEFVYLLSKKTYTPSKDSDSSRRVIKEYRKKVRLLHPDKWVRSGYRHVEEEYLRAAFQKLQEYHDAYLEKL